MSKRMKRFLFTPAYKRGVDRDWYGCGAGFVGDRYCHKHWTQYRLVGL